MSDRLPPLTALRAFEAAARHLSFAKAADELNVTPAALSFQIKSLEEHLGEPVFKRLNRAIELTEVGKLMVPGAREGFEALTASWRSARRYVDKNHLTVTAGPAFTAKWLAPRLYEFAQAHPEIELRFSAALRIMDFARDDIDVAIRFGRDPGEPGVYAFDLAEDWVIPVATPEIAKTLKDPQDLYDASLIVDQSILFLNPQPSWATWFATQGLEPPTRFGPQFSQADHAVDAALAGVGVVLGRRSLVIKDLAEGRLVAPFKSGVLTGGRFRFLCPEGLQNRPNVRAFREWMVAEIAKLQSISDDLDIFPLPDS